jgi:hypothetical protein
VLSAHKDLLLPLLLIWLLLFVCSAEIGNLCTQPRCKLLYSCSRLLYSV